MVDIESIALSKGVSDSSIKLIQLVFGIIIKSEEGSRYIEKIMDLDEDV